MSKAPFLSLSARCFCQATEYEEKVMEALCFILGEEGKDVDILADFSSGYHGNKILILSARTEKRKEITGVAQKLLEVKEELLPDIEERLDEERFFHTRVSKQKALEGEFVVSGARPPGGIIDISLKVESYPASWDKSLSALREWMSE